MIYIHKAQMQLSKVHVIVASKQRDITYNSRMPIHSTSLDSFLVGEVIFFCARMNLRSNIIAICSRLIPISS